MNVIYSMGSPLNLGTSGCGNDTAAASCWWLVCCNARNCNSSCVLTEGGGVFTALGVSGLPAWKGGALTFRPGGTLCGCGELVGVVGPTWTGGVASTKRFLGSGVGTRGVGIGA